MKSQGIDPKTAASLHPVAQSTLAACLHGVARTRGTRILPSWQVPHFDVEVSAQSVERVVRFLDKLARSLEGAGFRFEKPSGNNHHFILLHPPTGKEVLIRIMEPAKGVKRGLTDEEKESSEWKYGGRVLRPTGRVKIDVGYRPFTAENIWHEDSSQTLDDFLPEIAPACTAAAESSLSWDRHLAEQNRLYELAERRRQQEEKRHAAEQSRRSAFASAAANWRKAHEMREFLNVCEISLRRKSAGGVLTEQSSEWIAWAKGVIEAVDPLSNGYMENPSHNVD